MRVIVLQSGSNGNCTYVEAAGRRLLFDAGISGRQAQLRLAEFGREVTDVDALLISHDHRDHARAMGVFHRKFDLPVHVTEPTYRAAGQSNRLGVLDDLRHFTAGDALRFGAVRVETIPTPHDGADGVGFIVDDGLVRFGILTDLGYVFPELEQVIGTLDAVLLESNYDPGMLDHGPYPEFLKARIRGAGGHLSNVEAAQLLSQTSESHLQWACIGHLSEHNNCPELALRTHQEHINQGLKLHVASRYAASGEFRIER